MFVRSHLKGAKLTEKLTDERLQRLYESYGPGAYDLPDQGFIAKVHPLDLWLMGYLLNNPDAKFSQIVKASQFERQEVYSWLFKSRHKGARDSRIRTMLEIEAFLDIHQRWQKVGYPFDHLVPSLATAIGSSRRPSGSLGGADRYHPQRRRAHADTAHRQPAFCSEHAL